MTYSRKSAQRRVSNIQSILAPVGGLNDVDPLANMPAQYCIQMVNWIPGNSDLRARQGYREWCTGLGSPVKTVMSYYGMDGTQKIFAVTDTNIYDVTVSTATPPIAFTGVGNGRYNHTMYGNVSFQYLIAVNGGADPSVFYDGTSWKKFVQSATPAAPGEIKGVNPDVWSHVTAFKRRLWFVQANSATAWYLPIDAIGGEAKPFYLTSIFKRGGKLLYIINWSVDAGDGLDDKLIFVSDLGEVAVYSGDNPDTTATWRLDAVFYMSAPIGDKAHGEFGGDVLMTTNYGLIPLTKVLVGRLMEAPVEAALTKKINRLINRLVNLQERPRTWELYNIPNYQAIVLILPPFGETPALQLVMNSLTGAWTTLNLPINCGANVSGKFYFGTLDGRVCLYGENNYLDDVKLNGTGGETVICSYFSAYNYFGDPTTLKHFKLVRPVFQTDQPPAYRLRLNMDFDISALPGNPAPPGPEADNPIWDVSIWDQAFWSSSLTVFRPWVGVEGLGFCAATLMKVASNDITALVAMEYVFESGGAI